MKIKKYLFILTLLITFNSNSQNLKYVPTKLFYINAAQSDTDKDFIKVSSPFEVSVETNTINIGDKFDLKITKREFRKKEELNITELSVIDPSPEYKICKVFIVTDNEENYTIVTYSCKEDKDGKPNMIMKFTNSNYIAWYELWKGYRNESF